MSNLPETPKYKSLASATTIGFISIVVLIIGIICIIGTILGGKMNIFPGTDGWSSGIACIVTWALLSMMSHIAEDIHYQTHLQENDADDAEKHREESLQVLRNIQGMLEEQYHPQPVRYFSTPFIPVEELQQETQPPTQE